MPWAVREEFVAQPFSHSRSTARADCDESSEISGARRGAARVHHKPDTRILEEDRAAADGRLDIELPKLCGGWMCHGISTGFQQISPTWLSRLGLA